MTSASIVPLWLEKKLTLSLVAALSTERIHRTPHKQKPAEELSFPGRPHIHSLRINDGRNDCQNRNEIPIRSNVRCGCHDHGYGYGLAGSYGSPCDSHKWRNRGDRDQ